MLCLGPPSDLEWVVFLGTPLDIGYVVTLGPTAEIGQVVSPVSLVDNGWVYWLERAGGTCKPLFVGMLFRNLVGSTSWCWPVVSGV